MNSKTRENIKKAAAIFAGLSLLAYIGYQIYAVSFNPYVTETAYVYSTSDIIDAQAVVIRDESYISNSTPGTVVPIASDGKRVAKDDDVAIIFADEAGAENYNQILKIQEEIEYYQVLSNKSDVGTIDATLLDEEIKKNFDKCLDIIDKGNFEDFAESAREVASSITSRQIAIGSVMDFDAKLTELSNELASLKSAKSNYSTIAAPVSGYYISVTDGYENVADYDSVSSLKPADVDKIFDAKASVPADAMGKIVGRFDWYIVCNVPTDSTVGLEIDETLKVKFPNSSVGEVTAVIESINDGGEGTSTVILRANEMSEDITHLRFEEVQIVKNEYTGYRVSNTAIRTVDGENGVYVLSGNRVKFRKIKIIYSTEEYSVVEKLSPEEEPGYLRIYDEIIIKGKDLYDGKVVG